MMMTAKDRIRELLMASAPSRSTRLLCTSASSPEGEHKPLSRRILALRADPTGSVAETMETWIEERRPVSVPYVMKLVKELRKYKSYNHALELVQWMHAKGISITSGSHAVQLDLLSNVKGIDMAERYFSSLPESARKKETYGALLSCYCQEKMEDKAIALYAKMKHKKLPSSTLVHNNLMTLYKKLGQSEKVLAHFEEMKASNLPPDKATYSLVLGSYASQNDIDSVERFAGEMERVGVAVDWSTYCSLAATYNSLGLFDKAELTLKKIEKMLDRRDPSPYHHLITMYAGAGNLTEVNRVWKLLKASFPEASNLSYYNMLHSLRKLGDIDGLKNCFEEWESVHATYDIRLVNIMIDGYLSKGMAKEAAMMWHKAYERGFGSDLRILTLFMNYYVEKLEMPLALKFLQVIALVRREEWKPSIEKVRAVLDYFEEEKDVDGADDLCKTLKKLNCIDAEAYESLIRTYLTAGRNAPSLRDRIKEDGIDIGSESLELLKKVSVIG